MKTLLLVFALSFWGVPGEVSAQSSKRLTVTSILEEPYLMKNDEGKLEGFAVDLASQIASKLKVEYEIKVVKDKSYGRLNPITNKWSGMIGEVVEKDADLAIASLTITSQRSKVVDFSTPFFTAQLSILQKKGDAIEHYSFLKPLGYDLWGAIILVCVVAFGLLAADKGFNNPFFNFRNFFLGRCHSQEPKGSLASKIIWTTFTIFIAVIFASYIASFASRRVHGSDDKGSSSQLATFEDLANQDDIMYGVLGGGSTETYFEKSDRPLYKRMLKTMRKDRSLATSHKEGIERVRDGGFAFIMESPSATYLVNQEPCDLTETTIGPESGPQRSYGVATAKGSPLSEQVNQAVLDLSESGVIEQLISKWWTEQSVCDADHKPSEPNELDIKDMAGIFYIFLAGVLLALITAVLERKYKRDHGNTGNNVTFYLGDVKLESPKLIANPGPNESGADK